VPLANWPMVDIKKQDIMFFAIVTLQQQGAILRSKYHRKQQRKKFPKARCCEP
jgi:hypothetical protein